MDEYISKQRAKDLMGCCIASAKANLKVETNIFKKAEYESIIRTIESMIDVVGAVEAADVQPVKHGRWIDHEMFERNNCNPCIECSVCNTWFGCDCFPKTKFCPNCGAKLIKDGDSDA